MNTSILLLGSCFAENIGKKLIYHKMNACVNPTGISYNPVSLAIQVKRALKNNHVTIDELKKYGDQYVHFDFHGKMGHHEEEVCLRTINSSLDKLNVFLRQSDVIFISLGSAIVFELIESNQVVSNCHKFPQQIFNKRQLNNDEVVNSLSEMIQLVSEQNTKIKIVFTVSPVRHTRHGLIENNRSKANLISAVHSICDRFDNAYYFPSYDIVIDDLRDYRFYDQDLVHPSASAIDYIWSYLQESFMETKTIDQLKSIQSIVQTFHHRSMTSNIKKQINALDTLKNKMLDHLYNDRFEVELNEIDERIATLSAS